MNETSEASKAKPGRSGVRWSAAAGRPEMGGQTAIYGAVASGAIVGVWGVAVVGGGGGDGGGGGGNDGGGRRG